MTIDAHKPTAGKSRRGGGGATKTPAPAHDFVVEGPPSKLPQIVALLSRAEGASLAELTAATGWLPHSVRGALAGALKRKGHAILSDKVDGARRYRIGGAR